MERRVEANERPQIGIYMRGIFPISGWTIPKCTRGPTKDILNVMRAVIMNCSPKAEEERERAPEKFPRILFDEAPLKMQ